MDIRKLKKNKVSKSLVLATMFVLFASCSNIVGNSSQKQDDNSYSLSGNLIIDSVFTGNKNSEYLKDSSRTAMPAMPDSPVYYVEYSKEDEWDDESNHIIKTSGDAGVFTSNGSAITGFYIPLAKGTWVVVVGVKEGEIIHLKDKKTIPLTPENPKANENFFLTMAQTQNGKGKVSLTVEKESYSYDPDEGIPAVGFIEVKIQCSNGTIINTTKNGNKYSADNIPSGQQTILINAYDTSDNSGLLIFSAIQEIYIYDDLTTNQWVFDGVVQTGSNNKFQITKQKVKDFLPRQYFVDSREGIGLDSNTGTTKDSPFKTISRAIDVISQRSEDFMFTIHVKDGFEETRNETINLKKSIRIECWKDAPNDMKGKGTFNVYGNDYSIILGEVGEDEEHSGRTQLYLVAAGEDSGLTLDGTGNNGDCGAIQIINGTLLLDGGKITNYVMTESIDGAVCLEPLPSDSPDYVERIFVMKKGKISGNTSSHAGAVFVGTGTIFQLEGGKIINNISGSGYGAVTNNGYMSASGNIEIKDNSISGISDSKANLFLPQSTDPQNNSGKLNVLNISGSLSMNSSIGITPVFASDARLQPSSSNPIAITKNYTDSFSPSAVFMYDGDESEGLVITKSRNQVNFGEAAFTKGGGVFFRADDFIFTFDIDSASLKRDEEKSVTITPGILRKDIGENNTIKTKTLYYNPTDCGIYEDAGFTEPTAVQENEEEDYVVAPLIWPSRPELCMDGIPLPSKYQPQVKDDDPANKFTIPRLPYIGNYTLTVNVTYLGFEYSVSFNLSCTN